MQVMRVHLIGNKHNKVQNQYMKEIISKAFNKKQSIQIFSK